MPTSAPLMDTLNELGIAENTLVVAHADNGPMVHNAPPGTRLGNETIFRGGKSDYWEGGTQGGRVRMVARA